MTSPKYATFHNPYEHPDYDKKTGELLATKKPADTLKFRIQTHESGQFDDYELAPGEKITVPEKHAFAVKSIAPQMAEGEPPAPLVPILSQDVKKPAAK